MHRNSTTLVTIVYIVDW